VKYLTQVIHVVTEGERQRTILDMLSLLDSLLDKGWGTDPGTVVRALEMMSRDRTTMVSLDGLIYVYGFVPEEPIKRSTRTGKEYFEVSITAIGDRGRSIRIVARIGPEKEEDLAKLRDAAKRRGKVLVIGRQKRENVINVVRVLTREELEDLDKEPRGD